MRVRRVGMVVGLAMVLVIGGLAGGLPGAAEPQFVGHSKCKVCHLSEHKVWMASAHAKALEVLKPEDRSKPECLACHTTGHGKPAAPGADLAGVQCESCHGPGSLYKAASVMNKAKYQADRAAAHKASVDLGLITPTEQTCTSCHNSKSPTFKGFDFAGAKEKIKHWK
jgi:hypothetical protein